MILAGIYELWQSSWPAGAIMLGLGGSFALVLLIASEKLKVKEDPKIEQIHEVLPGLDCGGCGYAGCSQYAKAVSQNPELISRCAPGGKKTSDKIAAILNLQISDAGAPKKPIVHCRAHTEHKTFYGDYTGITTCTAANTLPGVQACHFGCLGLGDCTKVCRFDAIHIVEGLATIDYQKCTGCGACAKACPRELIEMVPFTHENMMTVACRNKEKGKVTRSMCKVGCIGCKLCSKVSDLFTVDDNLAKVTYGSYQPDDASEKARDKCPTGVIILTGKGAPAPREPKTKKAKASSSQ